MIRVVLTLLAVTLLFPREVLAGELLFPWRHDSSNWTWTSGWHGGVHVGGEALDFAPGSKIAILASQAGVITQICKGSRSYNLVIKSSSGLVLEYWHLSRDQLPPNIKVGAVVVRGQKLGITSGEHSYDGCGVSTGHHVHWVIGNRSKVDSIQGWKLDAASKLVRTGQVSWPGDSFSSTNQMNLGKEVGCWEGLHVFLIDHLFNIDSVYTIVCYAPKTITALGNTRVEAGQKLELRAGEKVTLTEGFRASAIGLSNSGTELSVRLGKYTF